MEGCARSRAADLASPTTVSPWPFCCAACSFFLFFFFFSPLGAAGSVKSKPAWPDRASSTRFMHPCEISSVISELQSAGLASLFSLLTLHQRRFVLPLGRGRQQEGGPCVKSERTSHLTPSPDLSQVALGGKGEHGQSRVVRCSSPRHLLGLDWLRNLLFLFRKGALAPFYVACSA